MRCGKCGTVNDNSGKFCSGCGDMLALKCPQCTASVTKTQTFCNQCGCGLAQSCGACGEKNPPKSRYCVYCGHVFENLCPQCGKINIKGSRFCGFCANPLSNACAECGFTNLPGQKFCGNCQKQLIKSESILKAPVSTPKRRATDVSVAQPLPPVADQPPPSLDIAGREAFTPGELLTLYPPEAGAAPTQPMPVSPPSLAPPLPPPADDDLHLPLDWVDASRQAVVNPLTEFALVSLEFMNYAQLVSSIEDKAAVDAFRTECANRIERVVQAAGGKVESIHNHILFITFERYPSTLASILAAVPTGLKLLRENFSFGDVALKLRIGLDVENAGSRDPITSTTERSIATAGQLVVSQRIRDLIIDEYACEPVGPLKIGSRMVTYYAVSPRTSELSASAPAIEPVQPVAAPNASAWTEEASISLPEAVHSTVEDAPSAPADFDAPTASEWDTQFPLETERSADKEPPSHAASSDTFGFGDEAPVTEPASPGVGSTSTDSGWTEAHPRPEAPPAAKNDEPPKTFDISYAPPVYASTAFPRPHNLTYERAVESLAAELSAFLDDEGDAKGRVIALCASEGLGRSNIIQMVRQQVDAHPENPRAVWMGANNYRGFGQDDIPLMFWVELIQNFFGLSLEGHPAEQARSLVADILHHIHAADPPPPDKLPPEEDILAFFEELLSIRPLEPISLASKQNLSRIEQCLGDFFSLLCLRKPVVLIVEDINQADNASLDVLVKLLMRGLLDNRVFLLFTQPKNHHPEGLLQSLLQMSSYKEFVIADLTEREVEKFLNDGPLAGSLHTIPLPLLEQLSRNAKGIPLYLEEALRLLHVQGVMQIDPETGMFSCVGDEAALGGASLPASIEEVIRQRLAHLSDIARYVLQLASVLGEKFSLGVLMDLCQLEGDVFNQCLQSLWEGGFIIPDVANSGRFRHGLLWRGAYDSMDAELREQLHTLMSEYLENADKNEAGMKFTIQPALIAYHARRGNLRNRAFHYWNLAGVFATQVGSLVGLNIALFKALELLTSGGLQGDAIPEPALELELRLNENLGVLNMQDNPDLAIQLLEKVAYHRQREGNQGKHLESLSFLSSCYEAKGDFQKALDSVQKSLTLFSRDEYPREYATMLINKLEYLHTLGRLQQGMDLVKSELEPLLDRPELRRSVSSGDEEDVLENSRLNAELIKAQIMLLQCDNAAFDLLDECLKNAEARGLRGHGIAVRLAQAQGLLYKGRYDQCRKNLEEMLEPIEALEQPEWFLAQWGLVALACHCETGDWKNASMLVPNSLYQAEKSSDYLTWVMTNTYAGRMACGMGSYQEAKSLLENAITLSSDYRYATTALLGWRFLAETEMSVESYEVALEIAGQALEIARKPEINNRYEAFLLTNVKALCLMKTGQAKQAGKLLEQAWPKVIQTGYPALIAQAAAGIGLLYKTLAASDAGANTDKHRKRSREFFGKALTLWKELGNPHQIDRVRAEMEVQ